MAEKAKRMQRAILKPQIAFISRQVDFVVPIQLLKSIFPPLTPRFDPRAVVRSNADDMLLSTELMIWQFRNDSGFPTTTATTISAIKNRPSMMVFRKNGIALSKNRMNVIAQ